MAAPPSGPRDPATRGIRALGGGESATVVLVANDDAAIRTAIVTLLEDEGYTTLQAGDGDETLELLRAADMPMVVLLDWMMPNLNGLTLLQMAAADPLLARKHAYLLTSAAFPAGLRHVAALPLTIHVDVLMQPINITVLLAKVAQAAARLDPVRQAPEAPTQQA